PRLSRTHRAHVATPAQRAPCRVQSARCTPNTTAAAREPPAFGPKSLPRMHRSLDHPQAPERQGNNDAAHRKHRRLANRYPTYREATDNESRQEKGEEDLHCLEATGSAFVRTLRSG